MTMPSMQGGAFTQAGQLQVRLMEALYVFVFRWRVSISTTWVSQPLDEEPRRRDAQHGDGHRFLRIDQIGRQRCRRETHRDWTAHSAMIIHSAAVMVTTPMQRRIMIHRDYNGLSLIIRRRQAQVCVDYKSHEIADTKPRSIAQPRGPDQRAHEQGSDQESASETGSCQGN